MIVVKKSTATLGFIRPVKFECTGRIVDKVIDCTEQELIDLAFHHLGVIEKAQGLAQNMGEELEAELGWTEGKDIA